MQEFRHYFLREHEGDRKSLYLSGPQVKYRLDDGGRTYWGGPCGCTAAQYPPLPENVRDDCAGFALQFFEMTQRTGEERVAGYRAVRYREKDSEGVVHELALAPELGCAAMEKVTTYPGRLGIPGARWHSRVTSYVRGEPNPAVFRIPPGYRREP